MGLESGPSSSSSSVLVFFISIRTPLWAHRRRNKWPSTKQGRKGRDNDLNQSECWRIYPGYIFFLVQISPYYLHYTWPENQNIRGRGIRSLISINRGSANRKGGVARKGKIFITFVSPSSAFRYAFTRRHLWGKTLLLYLSSTFWIYIPVTYLMRSQSRRTGTYPTSPLLGAYHRASNLLRGLSIFDHHGGNAPIDVVDGLTSSKARLSQQVNWVSWIDGNEIVAISYLLYASQFHKLVQPMNVDA